MAVNDWDVEVFRDGKRSELRVASYEYDKASPNYRLQRVNLATCPGGHCNCPNCRAMRARAMAAAKAPLGKRYDEGIKYIAVIFAGHSKIKVLGLFSTVLHAMAYVKANYKTEPLGKTRFVTKDGEVLIVQEHVHVMTLEET